MLLLHDQQQQQQNKKKERKRNSNKLLSIVPVHSSIYRIGYFCLFVVVHTAKWEFVRSQLSRSSPPFPHLLNKLYSLSVALNPFNHRVCKAFARNNFNRKLLSVCFGWNVTVLCWFFFLLAFRVCSGSAHIAELKLINWISLIRVTWNILFFFFFCGHYLLQSIAKMENQRRSGNDSSGNILGSCGELLGLLL